MAWMRNAGAIKLAIMATPRRSARHPSPVRNIKPSKKSANPR